MLRNPPGRHAHFRKSLLALAAGAALLPQTALAIDLAQAPPATVQPYVAPNVILSLDDSSSMQDTMIPKGSCTASITAPNADGTWSANACRYQILKYSVISVFSDTALLPDGKIRLAWQTYYTEGSNYCASYLTSADASKTDATKPNVMRVLQGDPGTVGSRTNTSRGRFLKCMDSFTAPGNTPTHRMMWAARQYLTAGLNANGPWATVPGDNSATRDTRYLACRRNYHILMTDGGWNNGIINVPNDGTANPANYDGNGRTLPDGMSYSTTDPDTRIFRDNQPSSTSNTYNVATPSVTGSNLASNASGMSTISDWAMYNWATQLQNPANLDEVKNGNAIQPSNDYLTASMSETFTNRVTGATATISNKYWNPRYDPATWPHMQTYTIGFSNDALPLSSWTAAGVDKKTVTYPSPVPPSTSMGVPFGYDGNFADYVNGTYSWYVPITLDGYGLSNTYNGKGLDMWHAAINGRGKYYSVTKSEDLKAAFQDIIGNIIVANTPSISTMAASGFNASRTAVGTFIAGYDPTNAWAGYVKSLLVNSDGSTTDNPAWGGQTTAQKLDAIPYSGTSRVILSWMDKWTGAAFAGGGIPFTFSALSPTQENMLNSSGGGDDRVQYLRGNRAKEVQNGGTLRNRTSIQGDIVDSSVWYTGAPANLYSLAGYSNFVSSNIGRTPMIYVGGNDGMLHGFGAADGKEKIAYVPRGVIPTLSQLTDPGYSHMYYVDGSPMTGDANFSGGGNDSAYTVAGGGGSAWHTVLVGTLGAGGRGYFVLDVTNPGSFSENSASSLVLTDRTRGNSETQASACSGENGAGLSACNAAWVADQDIGNITAAPVLDDVDGLRSTQIALMNNNKWAVVLGNGYNSPNQRPVLLIQYLDGTTNTLMGIFVPGAAYAVDNGLAAPRLVDINGDGRVDVAYAGDNQGNMWKFDLTSDNDSDWGVAFGGQPLFTATGPANAGGGRTLAQPITAPPIVRANDRKVDTGNPANPHASVGGLMVAFGTGRNVSTEDPASTAVQTLYSVLDNTRYTAFDANKGTRLKLATPHGSFGDPDYVPVPTPLGTGVAAANLAKQTVTSPGSAYSTVTANDTLTPSTWFGRNGWYMDFPATGERLLQAIQFYDGTNILSLYSQVPPKGSLDGVASTSTESCQSTTVASGSMYLTLVNIMDGTASPIPLVDTNGDGHYDSADGLVARLPVDYGPHTQTAVGDRIYDSTAGGSVGNTRILNRPPTQALLPSWRQWQ